MNKSTPQKPWRRRGARAERPMRPRPPRAQPRATGTPEPGPPRATGFHEARSSTTVTCCSVHLLFLVRHFGSFVLLIIINSIMTNSSMSITVFVVVVVYLFFGVSPQFAFPGHGMAGPKDKYCQLVLQKAHAVSQCRHRAITILHLS